MRRPRGEVRAQPREEAAESLHPLGAEEEHAAHDGSFGVAGAWVDGPTDLPQPPAELVRADLRVRRAREAVLDLRVPGVKEFPQLVPYLVRSAARLAYAVQL